MSLLNRGLLISALASSVLFVSATGAQAVRHNRFYVEFDPLPPFATARDSTATAEIVEVDDETTVTIVVLNAEPHTLYTVWIRLNGTNPVTRTGSTPMAPTTEIDAMLDHTPDIPDINACNQDCNCDPPGSDDPQDLVNAFVTDHRGNAVIQVTLDFRLSDREYPFDKYDDDFEEIDVKKEKDEAGGTLRIVSHFCDPPPGLGHGMIPGKHEKWFDWAIE
ncbi:MAG: hypothetical protein ACE5MG_09465 [Candidatus Methylomirabilales bacterium]